VSSEGEQSEEGVQPEKHQCDSDWKSQMALIVFEAMTHELVRWAVDTWTGNHG
jgi:hypothetical protein